jgi:subtilisin-like proprotein convertase family protein
MIFRSRLCALALGTAAIVSLAPQPARAIASFTGNGLGFDILDFTDSFSDIVVADNFSISDITVSLNNLTHTEIGDLTATLTHLDTNTSVDLFRRVGRTDLTNGFGNALDGTYKFNDAFIGDLWAVAISLNDFKIPGGDYFPTGGGSATKVPMLSTISGLSSSGTWRLTISDSGRDDTGALGSWTLNLQGSAPAPVPGPLPLMGAGAAFGWSRKVRRRLAAASPRSSFRL